MNVQGLALLLRSVDAAINPPLWYDGIVKAGVSAAELEGTREESSYLLRALLATPPEKIEHSSPSTTPN